jgi:hypothetical protein
MIWLVCLDGSTTSSYGFYKALKFMGPDDKIYLCAVAKRGKPKQTVTGKLGKYSGKLDVHSKWLDQKQKKEFEKDFLRSSAAKARLTAFGAICAKAKKAYTCEFRHSDNPGHEIAKVAHDRLADVIVVGKHFGSLPGEGRTTTHILNHAKCDVWIVRLPEPTHEEEEARQSALATVIEAEEQERLRRVIEAYGEPETASKEEAKKEQNKKDLESAIALEEEERMRRIEALSLSPSSVAWTAEPFSSDRARVELYRRSAEAESAGLFANADFNGGSA